MSSVSNLPPNVVESLKIFDCFVGECGSYEIPSSKVVKVVPLPLKVDLPELSDTSFFEFRKWFSDFENFAHYNSLTRGEITSVLIQHVPSFRRRIITNFMQSPDIRTIEDIQIKLT